MSETETPVVTGDRDPVTTGHHPRTLLAYGIAEWDSAITHLEAVQSTGVPIRMATIRDLRWERHLLVAQWEAGAGRTRALTEDVEAEVADEARTYLSAHPGELAALEREADHG